VAKEMTVKAGQKCTAIRRTFVPEAMVDDVVAAMRKRLGGVTVGDPAVDGVRMGPLAGRGQVEELNKSVAKLRQATELLFGGPGTLDVIGADPEKGAFVPTMLLYNDRPFERSEPHDVEAFGPVNTIMPYRSVDEATALAKLGKGSLVGSLFTARDDVARQVARVDVQSPVSDAGLRELIAARFAMRLPRDRPLWRIDVIEGLDGERVAYVLFLHHAMADGTAALRIGAALLWDEEADPATPEPAPWAPATAPGPPCGCAAQAGRAVQTLRRGRPSVETCASTR